MFNLPKIKLPVMDFFKKRSSQNVGIDIGSYAIKIAGLRPGAKPKLLFHSVINIPDRPDMTFIADAAARLLKKYNATRSDIYLNISDESVNIRRLELPAMPADELLSALKWQIKDRLAIDAESALLDYRQLRELQQGDGSKALELIFVAASDEAVEKKIAIFKKMNLNIAAINVSPFSLENILPFMGEETLRNTILVVDVGHARTDISVYKDRTLQFVRTIAIASADITNAIRGPIAIGMEKKEFKQEEAEEIKREVGIAYEPMRLEKGLTSIQVLTAIRSTLERFSKEIKRSIEYYTSEVSAGDAITAAYLTGGGAGLKNLDKYLNEELNMPVRRIDMPKLIDAAGQTVSQEDALSIMSAIGSALDTSRKVNLLPQEYRAKKAEFIEKVSLRLFSIIIGSVLAFSYLAVKLQVDDYARRTKGAIMHKDILMQVKALNEKIRQRERLAGIISSGETDVSYVMKVLSSLVPKTIILESLRLDTAGKTMEISGIVREAAAQTTLTRFMEDLEKSPLFKEAQLTVVEEKGSNMGAAESYFNISCQLE